MTRLGASLGLLYGLVECFAIHRAGDWAGTADAVLALAALYAALGALGGGLLGLLRVACGRRRRPGGAGLLAGILALAAAFGVPAALAHLAHPATAVALCGALAVGALAGAIAAGPRSYEARTGRAAEPRAATLAGRAAVALLVVGAVALAVWSWRDRSAPYPQGVAAVAQPAGSPAAREDDPAAAEPVVPASRRGAADATTRPPKLIVIGIDGGTWDLILPLIDRGRLPNLKALLDRGIAGVIDSSYEAFSPIEWTTMSTGKLPDKHGLYDIAHTQSTNRRVRTIWSILGDEGNRSLVANVPGTYPAEPVPGALFAGFPARKETLNSLGHLFTTRPAEAWTMPRGSIDMPAEPLPVEGEPGARRGRLVQREAPAAENRSALGTLKGRIADTPSLYSKWVETRYFTLEFEETARGLRFELPEEGGGPVTVAPGAWSPWIVLRRDPTPLAFRLHVVEADDAAISIYTTPMFRLDGQTRIQPPELARRVDAADGPYIVEGAGWLLFQAPELLEVLRQHQFAVSGQQLDAIERVWTGEAWDALFYIVTLTDRIQHAFWAFLDTERYPRIPPAPLYPYATGAEFDGSRFAETVPEAYGFADRAIGRLLRKAGPETLVLVLSDHGATSGPHATAPGAGIHHPDGIYLLAGGPFTRARLQSDAAADDGAPIASDVDSGYPDPRIRGERLALEDVTPTLLAALGHPLARDFDGGPSRLVLRHLRAQDRAPELIATYERGEAAAERADTELDASAIEQLRSLGYVQ